MKLLKLEIVTPKGTIYDGEAKQVTLPGSEGEFGVLPEHASLVSLLDGGVIDIQTADNKNIMVAIKSGYVKISENKTLCIVDGAVSLHDEDGDMSKNLDAAKELLKSAKISNLAMATAVSKIES